MDIIVVIASIVAIACFSVFYKKRGLPYRMLLALGYICVLQALIYSAKQDDDGFFFVFIACMAFGSAAVADAIRGRNTSPTTN